MADIENVLDYSHEIESRSVYRDGRTTSRKLADFLEDRDNMLVVSMIFIVTMIIGFAFVDWIFLMFAGYAWFVKSVQDSAQLGIVMPKSSGFMDPGNPHLETGKPTKADGIIYLGNEKKTRKELWLTNVQMRTHMLTFGTTGSGKAQPLDAKIHTPNGWVRMGDIKPGMLVSTPDGKSAPVLSVHPQGDKKVYQIKLGDERKTEACADHLWEILDNHGENATIVDTSTLMIMLEAGMQCNIRLPALLDLKEAELPFGIVKKEDYRVFLHGSIKQRVAMFRGLFDVGGKIAGDHVWFETTKEDIAADFQQLVWSLSGIAHKFQDQDDKHIVEVSFLPENILPVGHKFKASPLLKVVEIKDASVKPSQCILIDHPSHLYVTDDYIVTHNTEQLLGLVFNAIVQDSGFIYVDGKADSKLYANIYQMARFAGREDDVLTINFQKGGKDIFGAMTSKMSNTMNPFAFGSSGMLSQLLVGLMSSGESSGGDVWENRAILFTEALLKPLVFLRDKYGIMIDAHTIRSCFEFSKIEEMVVEYPKRYEGYADVVSGLKSYLVNIPGYDIVKTYKNPSETALEQHGYITMQLVRTLGSLADTYGYIMRTPMPEIDMRDVFLNRRILVVLLPALENSPQELTNLGRIIVASLKSTMAVGLGAELEGDYRRVIQAKPTTSKTPFICVLDEYGYYAVKGFAVVPAQARSLGFAACFAGQDLPGFEKSGKEEAESTIGNTTTQLCGFLKCVRTFEFFDKVAGEAFYLKSSGTEKHTTDLGSNDLSSKTNSYEKTRRINITELQKLKSGEWYIFRDGKILRARSFYTDLENEKVAGKLKTLRLNHFIRVAKMETKVADKWRQAHAKTISFLVGDKEKFGDTTGTIFDRIGRDFNQNLESSSLPPEKNMLNILMGILDHNQNNASETHSSVLSVMDTPIRKRMQLIRDGRSESLNDDIDAFNRVITGDNFDEIGDPRPDDFDNNYDQFGFEEDPRYQAMDAFSEPGDNPEDFPPAGIIDTGVNLESAGKKRQPRKAGILNEKKTQNSLESIEYLGGSDMESAKIMAREKLTELSAKTRYPITRPAAERAREYFAGSVEDIFHELDPDESGGSVQSSD